ncbi:1,4-alpha-glucan branching protein GlgB [Pseudomarimonas arenosa]|uniref:1,4-alpha-glucan branching enzyme GlgB n=1 Tax=Pseudomarimonas arenosa TaxID=2774145 RepID=A0AAW3ZML2_9GAMM|nr:1,4-alpha-glucan branching protein GlgB [Pseudomarimonas arenosa]MBD8527311.1 1,4-alpha-glucan branching protein GlgB [Pseudomarimonas arenosa]
MSLPALHVDALINAEHGDPFAVLGMHQAADGALWVRALLPGSRAVDLVDAISDKRICGLALRHPDGLYEARIPRRRKRFDYRFAVRWNSGAEDVYADAFAFGPQIDAAELILLREGRHPQPGAVLGAHPTEVAGVQGVRFALWAPNASRASVVGDFNQWDGRRHPMRLRHEAGVWETFVPDVGLGALYKFELLDRHGKLLPLKADPYARASELRPDTASRVAGWPDPRSLPEDRASRNRRDAPISIYEVHAPSWRQGDGLFPTWDELAESLPAYVASLGFTHIELMPISEYPFDGSWGYQTLGLYSASARFGETTGFERLVSACHQHGLGLLLDWVPAHFPNDAHGLAQFDGSHLYEYADPREGFHRDWNTLIYNFARTEVRSFLCGSALYWLQQQGVDGLRVDAVASMLYRDYSRPAGEWLPNRHGGRENLEAISLLREINERVGAECPGAITIAEESTAFPGVSAPTSSGGLGFHYKWNMGWMNDTLRYMQEDPVHRRWHHDKLSFGLVYAFSENFILPISHDEVVHGKGSMLGKMPGDDWQRFANLRAYYGFMWGHPGKKLLFMGQEFAQPNEWSHQDYLPWQLLDDPRHAGVQALIRDLNQLYQQEPALHQLDCEAAGFRWLVGDDAEQSVLAWLRHDGEGRHAMVICNFTPVPRHGYRLGLPAECASAWREVLNTDSHHYGGSDLGNGSQPRVREALAAHGQSTSITVDLPPLATLFLLPA